MQYFFKTVLMRAGSGCDVIYEGCGLVLCGQA